MGNYSKEKPESESRDFILFKEAILRNPADWTKEHIRILPIEYLKTLSPIVLGTIWNDLEESKRKNIELQTHLPCLEHYNRDEDEVHIDGPPPARYRCHICSH